MSRITCKVCRRLGESVCGREKCAYKKRPYAPGKLDSERKHRSSSSEYGQQLRAKQKLRISYGLSEKQFGNYVAKAMANIGKVEGVTPELYLYRTLENRLDNIVFRAGFAATRALARQMVSHGHILVNGKKITIASHLVSKEDVITIREGSKGSKLFSTLGEKLMAYQSPVWMVVDPQKTSVSIKEAAREVETGYDFQKVLEFYSR
jgi:small subunit ribosomal protein S4